MTMPATFTLDDAIIEINSEHMHFTASGGTFYDPDFGSIDECDVDLITDHDALAEDLKRIDLSLDPSAITLDGDKMLIDFGGQASEVAVGDTFVFEWEYTEAFDSTARWMPRSLTAELRETYKVTALVGVWNPEHGVFEVTVSLEFVDAPDNRAVY